MSLNKKIFIGGAAGITPTDHLMGIPYYGNSSTKTVTNFGFSPDMIHIKNRDQADPNIFFNTTQGNGYYFLSDTYHNMPASLSQFSFASGGFSAQAHGYINGAVNYMSWGWKANGGTTSTNTDGTITTTVQANQDAGFSIIRYNGNYTQGATIGHGLGKAPWIWMVVRISHGENKRSGWNGSNSPQVVTMDNATGMQPATSNTLFPSGSPSSNTVITLGNDPSVNYNSSYQYICYAWAPIPGFSAMGDYNGNGSTQQITTGFQPRLVWLKRKDSTGDWFMIDSFRGNNKILNLNDTTTEVTDTRLTFNSTGFQLNATADTNGSGTSHYYCAWA